MITSKPLISPQRLTTSTATYYTSTNLTTRVDKFTVTNTTAGAVTVTIYLVPSAGTADDGTTITSAKSIQGGETWNCPDMVGQVLGLGGTIQAKASAATSLTVSAAGVTIS